MIKIPIDGYIIYVSSTTTTVIAVVVVVVVVVVVGVVVVVVVVVIVEGNPRKFGGENRTNTKNILFENFPVAPQPGLGNPWGTLGGPRENLKNIWDYSNFLDVFPEFSWI